MHESVVCQEIFDSVLSAAEKHGLTRIKSTFARGSSILGLEEGRPGTRSEPVCELGSVSGIIAFRNMSEGAVAPLIKDLAYDFVWPAYTHGGSLDYDCHRCLDHRCFHCEGLHRRAEEVGVALLEGFHDRRAFE